MKKIILLTIASLPLMVSAQNTFTVKGKIGDNSAPARAFLLYRDGKKVITDSTMLNKGSFRFTGPVGAPQAARIIIDHKGEGLAKTGAKSDMSMIYLEKGMISINSKDSLKRAVITGSPINDEKKIYDAFIAVTSKQIDDINAEYAAAPKEKQKDQEFIKGIRAKYAKVSTAHQIRQREFIKSNPGSYFSLVALKDIAGQVINVKEIEPVFNSLSPNMQQSSAGQEFKKLLDLARATSIGKMAPDFTQNDANEQPVKLSDFKGKYVLIDFWASWCAPCRAENPNVVKAYNQYKNKGFTVIGISLDQPGKKAAWLAAVKADGLEWTQLSDLKFWNNEVAVLYGIKSIPQNFLLDKDGKIVAANLRGEDLEKTLAKLL
jgi:peroxiredoxin